MSTSSFMLEIYEPGSEKDFICSYFADTAFPAISEGQVLNFRKLGQRVRVSKIVHLIWETEELNSFKTLIFTEELPS